MSCHIPPERQLRRLSKSGKKTPSIPLSDLNVLNRKPTSGRSGSPWAIGPCAYLKVTRLRGFGLVIMPPTKGSSSRCAKVSNCMIAGDVPKALRVLKESHQSNQPNESNGFFSLNDPNALNDLNSLNGAFGFKCSNGENVIYFKKRSKSFEV